jgi:5'-AMP-activated protein kinase regulatory beta subunit
MVQEQIAGSSGALDIPDMTHAPLEPTLIPTVITWAHGGSVVEVQGSFDNWTTRSPLQQVRLLSTALGLSLSLNSKPTAHKGWSWLELTGGARRERWQVGKDYSIVKMLLPAVYQYKFIVDGEWKYAPDQVTLHPRCMHESAASRSLTYTPVVAVELHLTPSSQRRSCLFAVLRRASPVRLDARAETTSARGAGKALAAVWQSISQSG